MSKITYFHKQNWYKKQGSQKQKYFVHLWWGVWLPASEDAAGGPGRGRGRVRRWGASTTARSVCRMSLDHTSLKFMNCLKYKCCTCQRGQLSLGPACLPDDSISGLDASLGSIASNFNLHYFSSILLFCIWKGVNVEIPFCVCIVHSNYSSNHVTPS